MTTTETLLTLADQGACASIDTDVFFPEGSGDIHNKIAEAKAICADCPVVALCLNYAISAKEWGVWGGTTMKEREYLKRFPTRKGTYLRELHLSQGRRNLVTITDENTIIKESK